ncbi:hypothetical protein BABA_20006 [Neobacillus bataviensis LMG 21833]|uniref:Protein-glutamine gamma-glutamyltransferase-like C-terminal domain-containing protein n=1 Tax=Neobacillus bataviensis LMG 21833 TaxID=1117379 RepID=K6DBL9_9BACI|nr:DUF4129 domain-containing protein [Neobacillus bataviensis]EKN65458.1 hypothetical protein BABA_20006 [Neobacillus bataviensis LMG 21833]
MIDANKARDDIEDILNAKEYSVYNESKGFIQTWWENAKKWLAEQLEKLFPAIKSASSASEPILIAIIVIVVILLGFLTFFLIRNTKRNVKLCKQKPLQSLKEINWTYGRHLDEAKEYESSAEYSHSTRHLFLALLLYLHDKGWLEARIWKTNWDYFDELRKVDQQHAEQFYRLAHFFDEVTYGERTVSKEEYVQFKQEAMVWLGERGEESS